MVNAVGDVVAADGTPIVASQAPPDAPAFPDEAPFESELMSRFVAQQHAKGNDI